MKGRRRQVVRCRFRERHEHRVASNGLIRADTVRLAKSVIHVHSTVRCCRFVHHAERCRIEGNERSKVDIELRLDYLSCWRRGRSASTCPRAREDVRLRRMEYSRRTRCVVGLRYVESELSLLQRHVFRLQPCQEIAKIIVFRNCLLVLGLKSSNLVFQLVYQTRFMVSLRRAW